MKVLLVTPEYPPDVSGGIRIYCRDLANELIALGCKVKVLKGSAFVNGAGPYQHEGIDVEVLDAGRFQDWSNRFSHFAMFPELRRHLAAGFAMHEQAKEGDGFDAVEVTDWGFLYLPWVIKSKARLLVQLHGSTGQIAHFEPVGGRESEGAVSLFLDRIGLAMAPALSSQSHANIRWWEPILGRPIAFQPPLLKPRTQADTNSPTGEKWLSVGRIQHWKGPQVACAAWARLGGDAPVLEWVGGDTVSGENGQRTSARLSEQFPNVWGNTVCPVGHASPEEWWRRLQAAKIILVPSLWDVLNRFTLEAMALGKVVVVSGGAGVAEFIRHDVNGFVFPNNNEEALAEMVRQIQGLSEDKLRSIGQNAASTISEQLNPRRIAEQRLSLYKSLPVGTGEGGHWLRQALLPGSKTTPLGFLDGLPLKDLTAYVVRRGSKKISRRKN